jgi:uncharacterized protein (DUF983 family)
MYEDMKPCPRCGSSRVGQLVFNPQKKCLDCGFWAASAEQWNATIKETDQCSKKQPD